jgi:hypothetical protein
MTSKTPKTLTMTGTKMLTLTISEETYAIVHKLMSIGMDQVLDAPETDPDTMGRVLNAVTLFSTWNPVTVEELDQLAGI